MRISFFAENDEFDKSAVLGGVYAVEAINEKTGKSALLYVRESENMAASAANVLKKVSVYPEYLGLSKGLVGSDDLHITVKALEYIRTRKTFSTLGVYRDAEVNAIKTQKPLVQHKANHYMISERKREELVRASLDM